NLLISQCEHSSYCHIFSSSSASSTSSSNRLTTSSPHIFLATSRRIVSLTSGSSCRFISPTAFAHHSRFSFSLSSSSPAQSWISFHTANVI
ncbi:hypothetical protein PENTCL1PPCAC_19788, partial [Pristionchus entomophagus]